MPVRLTQPEGPRALHLIRLAQGSPGHWVTLPGGSLQVVRPAGKLAGQTARGWLVCLRGEAVIDLPQREFVRLRAGEGYALEGGWDALPTRDDTVLLLAPVN